MIPDQKPLAPEREAEIRRNLADSYDEMYEYEFDMQDLLAALDHERQLAAATKADRDLLAVLMDQFQVIDYGRHTIRATEGYWYIDDQPGSYPSACSAIFAAQAKGPSDA